MTENHLIIQTYNRYATNTVEIVQFAISSGVFLYKNGNLQQFQTERNYITVKHSEIIEQKLDISKVMNWAYTLFYTPHSLKLMEIIKMQRTFILLIYQSDGIQKESFHTI